MYAQDFEMAFLTTTSEFYGREAKQMLAAHDATVYLRKVPCLASRSQLVEPPSAPVSNGRARCPSADRARPFRRSRRASGRRWTGPCSTWTRAR